MDAILKQLVPTNKIKTNRLEQHDGGVFVYYDRAEDELLIQIVPPDTDTVVHYMEDSIAILYERKTKEVVGILVEDFKTDFLRKHSAVAKAWKTTTRIKDFGDIAVEFEIRQPVIAKEVLKASQPILKRRDSDLATLLAKRIISSESFANAS